MNKYCEDISLPTVANRLSDIIIQYETVNKIPVNYESDFEIDDEVVTEEEYLKLMENHNSNKKEEDIMVLEDDVNVILRSAFDNDTKR